jgi:prepilin-type N-terminal cleavage/methylation domain-containing protein
MRHGFTVIEMCVVVAIIAILAGMLIPAITLIRNSAQKQKAKEQGTEQTTDKWKTSENMTPTGPFGTFIITDPTNNQKWLCVQRGSSASIIPYVPLEVKAEK